MLERLDLAYAINAHVAQGVTAEHGIVVMSARERNLANVRSFLVLVTRIVDNAALVVDDGRRLEAAVMRNPGDKTSALDIVGQPGRHDLILLPGPDTAIGRAVEQYARGWLGTERSAEQGQSPHRQDIQDRNGAHWDVNHARAEGSEDLRIVLDRDPKLGTDLARGDATPVMRAWVEEGRVRADPAAYADRFVADWRAASIQHVEARPGPETVRAERRVERLVERMGEQPALERALDAKMPEQQRQIGDLDVGIGRSRDRGMDLGR